MKVLRSTLVLLAVVSALTGTEALADGFVIVRPRPEHPDPTQLAVRYHNVDIRVRDQVATIEIDQVFRNLNRHEVEGEYIFPIPEGAAVSDFVLWVDGRPIHAEAMDAKQARRVYEEIVRQQKDPALLEYAGREMFRARIYPFPPHGDRRVNLKYEQLIEREGGLYKLIYPLSTEKFSSRPLESASVIVDLEADRPIRNAYCPTHDVDVEFLTERRLRISWEENGTRPDRDMVFYYSLAETEMDMRLVPYRPDRGEDGYFMLLASMGYDDRMPVAPKDVVFVIDRSGSMKGVKMDQARDALVYCLEHLNRDDRFNIVSFNSSVESYSPDLVGADRREVRRGVRFAEDLIAAGGTNIGEALEQAMGCSFSRGRPGFVVFLSDGLPTVGERDPQRILQRISSRGGGQRKQEWDDRGRGRRRGPVRIFPFGVGYDVGATFLDQLAAENGGFPTYVRPSEDLTEAVVGFYEQVAHPVMTDLEIEIDGARLFDLQPGQLPDIFRGRQLVLFGRYEGSGLVRVRLSGRVQGERRTYERREELPQREQNNDFIARLWATRRVGSLLREIRLYGEERELVEEVKSLGLAFGIGTPYTSFLVDESRPYLADQDAGRGGRVRSQDLLSSGGGGEAWGSVKGMFGDERHELAAPAMSKKSGQAAFELSKEVEELASAKTDRRDAARHVRRIGGVTYRFGNGRWVASDCPEEVLADEHRRVQLTFGSDAYFELLSDHPQLGKVLALGENVIFVIDGKWYETVPAKGD